MNASAAGRFVLYGRPGSGSAPVEALLVLAGLPHDIVDVEKSGETLSREKLLALNPLNQVPTLELPNGEIMTESAAILIYLADIAPEARLCPRPFDEARSDYLRLMLFLSANIYMNDLRVYYPERYAADPGCARSVHEAAAQRKTAEWNVFEALYSASRLPRAVGALELYAATLADWNQNIDEFARRCPRVSAMARKVASDPRVKAVWKRHQIRKIPETV